MTVEDWAEIRRLHRVEGVAIKAIARRLGVSRNAVRRALARDAPPKYVRAPKGSIVDAVEPAIRELLREHPRMPATVIAERVGWERSLTVLKDRVRELRPYYLPPDPATRTAYDPGQRVQCDLWFPPASVPLGFGHTGHPPVLVMVSGYSRMIFAQMLPTRQAPDLIAGHWALLQLAHNEWDPAAKSARMKVLYNFGRAEELDRAAVQRLIGSLSRLLGETSRGSQVEDQAGGLPGLGFIESRPLGGAWVLDALWTRLGIAKTMRTLLSGTRRDATVERVLFALVANRALAPSSKLAAAGWVNRDVHVPGLSEVSDDACYRAMDWLLAVEPALAKDVYASTADLLNLQVDLLFFDTTSTYFETETGDEPLWRDVKGNPVATTIDTTADGDGDDDGGELPSGAVKQAGFRTYGKSKDHREDLPQVVVGMAVTREGIPVRVWCWPGNTSDSALIRQVKDDMRDWNLARVVWVADRGFTSAENRRYLQRAGGGYILGEKLRSGSAEATAALGRAGRYQDVADNLRVKEVRISESERFVICHNPEAADRDALVRTELLARLTEMIKNSDKLTKTKRAELRGVISTKPGLNRYLRVTPSGLLRIDADAIAEEAKLDGKYLLRSSDPHLSAQDIALGYKQLLEVERGWRDMKQILDLRPVHHRLEDRIRAHVVLCWLALLLIRIIETTTGDTWNNLRAELQRLYVGTFTGPAGTYQQSTDLTSEQAKILAQLDITAPPRILDLATAG